MCVYLYAWPIPHCIITFVRCNVQKSALYVCLPFNFINFWYPLSNYLLFIRSSKNKHTADISYILLTLIPFAVFFFIINWLACPIFPQSSMKGSMKTKKEGKKSHTEKGLLIKFSINKWENYARANTALTQAISYRCKIIVQIVQMILKMML